MYDPWFHLSNGHIAYQPFCFSRIINLFIFIGQPIDLVVCRQKIPAWHGSAKKRRWALDVSLKVRIVKTGVIELRKAKKPIHVTISVCSGNPAGGFPKRKMKSNVANCHPNLSPALVAYWINTNTFRHLWSIEKLPAILTIFPGMLF